MGSILQEQAHTRAHVPATLWKRLPLRFRRFGTHAIIGGIPATADSQLPARSEL